jgi:hypothetical protein
MINLLTMYNYTVTMDTYTKQPKENIMKALLLVTLQSLTITAIGITCIVYYFQSLTTAWGL